MISQLPISLLVGAGAVCGTHHSHSDRTGTPFSLSFLEPTPQRARFEPFFWPFLLEEGRGLGLPFWPEPVPPPSPRASMAAACSPSSLQHLPWRRCLLRPSLLAYFLQQSGHSKGPCCEAASYSALQTRSGRPAPQPWPRRSPPLGAWPRGGRCACRTGCPRCRDRPPRPPRWRGRSGRRPAPPSDPPCSSCGCDRRWCGWR